MHMVCQTSRNVSTTTHSRILQLFVTLVLSLNLYALPLFAQETKQVRGVIHLDSTISGGEMGPEELVRFLKENELEVAIFTDQITTNVHYGFFPFPAFTEWLSNKLAASKFGRESSVSTFGADNYLSLLRDLDRKYSDMTVIAGVEAFPFYYWRENLLRGQITMVDGHKHLLAIGLEQPSDYENMPTLGEGFFRAYNLQSLLSLWPFALFIFAFKCYLQSKRAERPALFKIPALIFLIVGGLFLLNNYPYKFGRYDAYHGDQGPRPYQDFVDYVIGRGGLVFWAHPEASKDQTYAMGPLTVNMQTEAPYKDMLEVYNYTGFAAFFEGMKYIIPPGGIWDQVLTEYCFGQRARPIWAIAEGDVEGDGFDPGLSQTVFLVKEHTRKAMLTALRTGQIYAIAGPFADDLSLDTFTLSDDEGKQVGMGQTLESKAVHLVANIRLNGNEKRNSLSADLIKNGLLIQTFKGNGQINIDLQDTIDGTNRHHYYRLDVRGPNQTRLISNPIFAHATDS
ncbi:MAG: hypothetical protein ACI8V2_004802 [Candidatus Latescibacterota bacterium]|jgi:hypothetical protein